MKLHLKTSSAKWRIFYPGGDDLIKRLDSITFPGIMRQLGPYWRLYIHAYVALCGLFYWYGLTFTPAWISNHLYHKCRMKSLIHSQTSKQPHFAGHVITLSMLELKLNHVSKRDSRYHIIWPFKATLQTRQLNDIRLYGTPPELVRQYFRCIPTCGPFY